MKTIYSLEEFNSPSIVVLGNFDGVHKAHQMLIESAVNKAKKDNLPSIVFTFSNLPVNVINKQTVVKNIFSNEEKLGAFSKLGIEYTYCINFDEYIQHISPENFIKDILIDKLKAKTVFCGFNYSFGFMGKGNTDILKNYSNDLEVFVMDEYKIGNETVSSTSIRKFLSLGDLKKYEEFTGRKYSITGTVVEGMHLGGRLGFPTLNLNLSEDMQLPKSGVYFTRTKIYDDTNNIYNSITNVGNKPSAGTFSKNAETYLLNFDGNLYGKNIKVEFLEFVRPEIKFESLEKLENQIKKDCKSALLFFS